MADKKISALTGASTPLAGTEVLPIVQSGSTVKVSVANLTVGRAVATAGGSFTDNITQSTAAKGVNFTANTPAAGMTSQLLNWYEEGTFTPSFSFTSGSVTYSAQNGVYTRVGNVVTLNFWIAVNTVSTPAGTLKVSGLPFAAKNVRYRPSPSLRSYDLTGVTGVIGGYVDLGESDIRINTYNNGTSSTTDAAVLANGCEIGGTLVYIV